MVTLQPLFHRDKMCVAILWHHNEAIDKAVRNFAGRQFSISNHCWYIPYSIERLTRLRETLEQITEVVICDHVGQDFPREILLSESERPEIQVPKDYIETLKRLRYSE